MVWSGLVWSGLVCKHHLEWDEAVITSVATKQPTDRPNNYPIIVPLQIFLFDLLDLLKSGDWQFVWLCGKLWTLYEQTVKFMCLEWYTNKQPPDCCSALYKFSQMQNSPVLLRALKVLFNTQFLSSAHRSVSYLQYTTPSAAQRSVSSLQKTFPSSDHRSVSSPQNTLPQLCSPPCNFSPLHNF